MEERASSRSCGSRCQTLAGLSFKGESWDDTFPLRSKSGEYRWFLSRAQPIRDDSGKIRRWFGTNTDVTETKQVEDALRAKEEQMRLGIEVAEFAIAQIDYQTDTIHLSSEAASLYGIGDQEIRRSSKTRPRDVSS
jgi:PAS domain-containing protein